SRNFEIDILVHVAMEIQLALLHLLHHCRPSKQLGNRSGAEQCVVGRDSNFPSLTIMITAPAISSRANCNGITPARNASTSAAVSSCVVGIGGCSASTGGFFALGTKGFGTCGF